MLKFDSMIILKQSDIKPTWESVYEVQETKLDIWTSVDISARIKIDQPVRSEIWNQVHINIFSSIHRKLNEMRRSGNTDIFYLE
jgi:hypothetical protein